MIAEQVNDSSMDLPEVVLQSKLLQHYSKSSDPYLEVRDIESLGNDRFLVQAGHSSLAGFGRAPTRRLASVKAIAEHFERRLMVEAFNNELNHVPGWLRTSNGFAVHFSPSEAKQSATVEALERHILQLTYFKEGWLGFYEIGEESVGDIFLKRIVSNYSCAGYGAGIVIATSEKFQGVSFGYLCDKEADLITSRRWEHAAHEAIDKINPLLDLAPEQGSVALPMTRDLLKWLTEPFEIPAFGKKAPKMLEAPGLDCKLFDLKDRWQLDFPLYGALCSSENILPLIVPGRIRPTDKASVSEVLSRFGLSVDQINRNPIL